MNDVQQEIKAKSEELTRTSAGLTKKHADYKRLLEEIAFDSSRAQTLMRELAALRSQLPAAHPAGTQPDWFDSKATVETRAGAMGDRLKISN